MGVGLALPVLWGWSYANRGSPASVVCRRDPRPVTEDSEREQR